MYPTEGNVTEINVMNVSDGSTNLSKKDLSYDKVNYNLWIFIESFLFVVIILGNVMTILAIMWSRRLRTVISNYFILNLAVSDLMVGAGLPCHLAFYLDSTLSQNKLVCLIRFVIVTIGSTGSIYSLIVIALDRYIAIVYPLSYNVYATQRYVLLIIAIAWIWTIGVSSIPIYWNHFDVSHKCEYNDVMPRYCQSSSPFL